MEFMRDVQQKQDGGSTWGNALAITLDEFRDSRIERLDNEQTRIDNEREQVANLFG